jgi:FAD:protein FMN transferase
MGFDISIRADEVDVDAVRDLIAETEETFSRFRRDSELTRLNASPSPIVAVSPRFARALEVALAAAWATDGVVDPTLGRAIVSAGYDRDFTTLTADSRPPDRTERGRWRELSVGGTLVRRPPGVLLDLNGVVKGLLVDELLEIVDGDLLPARSPPGARTLPAGCGTR